MRSEVTIGAILGLVLGGLVVFGLARETSPRPVPPGVGDLAPLELTDLGGLDRSHAASTDGGHRPVRPGSGRLHADDAARS